MVPSSHHDNDADNEPSSSPPETPSTPSPPPPLYKLRLFQTLQASQNDHGSSTSGTSSVVGMSSASSLRWDFDGSAGNDDSHRFYASYRRYCSAKLARTIHHRSVRHDLVHSHRYGSNSSSKRAHHNSYCPRNMTEPSRVVHEDHLWNLAYLSERSWARACEIMHQHHRALPPTSSGGGSSSRSSRKNKKKRRNQVVRKLNKAAQWSLALWELSKTCCDPPSVRECHSYHLYLRGTCALEKKHYGAALECYRHSLSLLLELAEELSSTTATTTSPSSIEDLAMRDVWTTRAESLLRPLVRFCEYESRSTGVDPGGAGIGAAAPEAGTASSSPSLRDSGGAKSTPREGDIMLAFRGRQVALDSYQDLAVLYLKMEQRLLGDGGGFPSARQNEKEGSVATTMDEDAFLALVNDLDAGIRMVQTEFKRYESLPDGPAVASKRADLRTIRQYFEYHKLVLWREQQERRLAQTKTDADLLYVYDTLLQNALSTAELQQQQTKPGVSAIGGNSSASTLLLDDPIWLETQAHVLRFRAFRCYYLARQYEEETLWVQAAALYQQAGKLAIRAQEEALACDGMESYASSLDELLVRIRASQCRMQALELLQEMGAPAVVVTDRPLWMRLNDWDPGSSTVAAANRGDPNADATLSISLADNPPRMIPVPCKPSFFDVAWQHVPRDESVARDIADYIESRQPKRGFLEWVRGGWK